MENKDECSTCGCDFEELYKQSDGTFICDHCGTMYAEMHRCSEDSFYDTLESEISARISFVNDEKRCMGC